MSPTYRYAVALGSNRRHGRYGDPRRVIAAAIDALEAEGVAVPRRSATIATPAMGPAGRGFANAVAIVETPLDPPALLALAKRIERAFGRRGGRRWGARVIDLDIVLWSGGSWPLGLRRAAPHRLAIPHRDHAVRAFVLQPLAQVAPEWRGAGTRTVRQARARLSKPRSL